ncbi:MAG: rhodanese-like domain-containing protein [Verrucomicrobiales bacterium]|nr:rhodanese-like domain-containing protein [Verrucomicrobiales bacterium]
MSTVAESPSIDGEITMGEVLDRFPGAKRALFARYHIGGCQSCSYDNSETLAEVCERNEDLPVDEVIEHILSAHENDRKILIEPTDLQKRLEGKEDLRMLDLRTREEFEAVALPDSELFSNDLLQEIFGSEPKDRLIVLYDHTGDKTLDPAAYLIGHGFHNTRALRGGIDAYAQEADTSIPRYKLEFED